MKHKNLVLDKLSRLDNLFKILEFNITRNNSYSEISSNIQDIKEKMNEIIQTINLESNTFGID